MIYQSGTSVGSVSGIGIDGDGGFGLASGRGVSHTLLARKAAPPSSPIFYLVLGFIFIVGGFFATFTGASYTVLYFSVTLWAPLIGFCLAVAVGVLAFKVIYDGYKKHQAEYEIQADRWENSWMCLRCGYSWMPRPKRINAVSPVRRMPEDVLDR